MVNSAVDKISGPEISNTALNCPVSGNRSYDSPKDWSGLAMQQDAVVGEESSFEEHSRLRQLWREYELSCPQLTCEFVETFAPNFLLFTAPKSEHSLSL